MLTILYFQLFKCEIHSFSIEYTFNISMLNAGKRKDLKGLELQVFLVNHLLSFDVSSLFQSVLKHLGFDLP